MRVEELEREEENTRRVQEKRERGEKSRGKHMRSKISSTSTSSVPLCTVQFPPPSPPSDAHKGHL